MTFGYRLSACLVPGKGQRAEVHLLQHGRSTDMANVHISSTSGRRFTHLFARITEEDHSYVVQVKLHNGATTTPKNAAWGEETADSIETAAEMITVLAKRFSIPQDRIKLEIRIDDVGANTFH